MHGTESRSRHSTSICPTSHLTPLSPPPPDSQAAAEEEWAKKAKEERDRREAQEQTARVSVLAAWPFRAPECVLPCDVSDVIRGLGVCNAGGGGGLDQGHLGILLSPGPTPGMEP